jgi:hypothetical protein
MTETIKKHALEVLGELKDFVQGQPGFLKNAELKALYVIASTAEGAVMFGDTEELARVCATFAGKKAREMDDGGDPFKVIGL